MRNIKCTVAYDGTEYCGYQKQNGQPTVQDELEEAVAKIFGSRTTVYASGRTDSGVHAEGQVINFRADERIPTQRIVPALNSVLPEDIVVRNAEVVDERFHARISAKNKTYVYYILNSPLPCPFRRRYSLHFPARLDTDRMSQAAALLLGKHDFSAFQAAGSSVINTVRTMTQSHVHTDNNMILYTAAADGFLYNMVRVIVGTLMEIGKGKMQPEMMTMLLKSGSREDAGPTAASHGLFLKEVEY